MFHPLMSAFVAILFFLLTPGILVSLPRKGNKFVVAATHAVIFSLVFHLTHKSFLNYFYDNSEGFGTNLENMRDTMQITLDNTKDTKKKNELKKSINSLNLLIKAEAAKPAKAAKAVPK